MSMQDPESLYRRALDRLAELHAAADRLEMVRRAGIRKKAGAPTRLARWLGALVTSTVVGRRRDESGVER
jgi:hypothetical protein